MTAPKTYYSLCEYKQYGTYDHPVNNTTACSDYLTIRNFNNLYNEWREQLLIEILKIMPSKAEKLLATFREAIDAGNNVTMKHIAKCNEMIAIHKDTLLGLVHGVMAYCQLCFDRSRNTGTLKLN